MEQIPCKLHGVKVLKDCNGSDNLVNDSDARCKEQPKARHTKGTVPPAKIFPSRPYCLTIVTSRRAVRPMSSVTQTIWAPGASSAKQGVSGATFPTGRPSTYQ